MICGSGGAGRGADRRGGGRLSIRRGADRWALGGLFGAARGRLAGASWPARRQERESQKGWRRPVQASGVGGGAHWVGRRAAWITIAGGRSVKGPVGFLGLGLPQAWGTPWAGGTAGRTGLVSALVASEGRGTGGRTFLGLAEGFSDRGGGQLLGLLVLTEEVIRGGSGGELHCGLGRRRRGGDEVRSRGWLR